MANELGFRAAATVVASCAVRTLRNEFGRDGDQSACQREPGTRRGSTPLIYSIDGIVPQIDSAAFVHPDAVLIGDVLVEAHASVWPHAVLRGDFGRIEVLEGSSVQDGTVMHSGPDMPTIIGPYALVGHNAHVEGAVVEPWAMVASMSTVLHRCIVRSHAIVGAGAVVPNNTEVPSRSMALGVPCTIRPNVVEEFANRYAIQTYVENAARYRTRMSRVG